jgi:hypothetical protein
MERSHSIERRMWKKRGDAFYVFYNSQKLTDFRRRLLYVGCEVNDDRTVHKTLIDFVGTRAQGLLYLTHAKERMLAGTCSSSLSSRLLIICPGNKQEKKLSKFITIPVQKKKVRNPQSR